MASPGLSFVLLSFPSNFSISSTARALPGLDILDNESMGSNRRGDQVKNGPYPAVFSPRYISTSPGLENLLKLAGIRESRITETHLDQLSESELNGREIKYAIKTAYVLPQPERPVEMSHLRMVLKFPKRIDSWQGGNN